MREVVFIAMPLAWAAFRLYLLVSMPNRSARLDGAASRFPYGPNPEARGADPTPWLALASGLAVALGFGGLFWPSPALSVLTGLIGLVAGITVDRWLSRTVQPYLARRRVRRELRLVAGWLHAGTDDEKRQAARVLGFLRRDPEVVQHLSGLREALRAPNPAVRFEAGCAIMAVLEAQGGDDSRLVAALEIALEDPDVRVRAPAARALLAAAAAGVSETIGPLAAALSSDDPLAWGVVTAYLDGPRRGTHLVLPQIFRAVEAHGERYPRSLDRCFEFIEPAGRPDLEKALQGPCPQVRRLAKIGLAHLGRPPLRGPFLPDRRKPAPPERSDRQAASGPAATARDDGFYRCPQCGGVEVERRLKCGCGYRKPSMRWEGGDAAEKPKKKRSWSGAFFMAALFGAGILWAGVTEYRLKENATRVPSDVTLEELEAGARPPQFHLRIGRHVRRYESLVYSIKERDKDRPEATVDYALFPVVSEAAQQAGKKDFAMLVISHQRCRLGDLPSATGPWSGLQGMLVNSVQDLDEDARRLIQQEYPAVDLTRVLVLEEGRQPSDPSHITLLLVSGFLSCLVGGLGLMWRLWVFAQGG